MPQGTPIQGLRSPGFSNPIHSFSQEEQPLRGPGCSGLHVSSPTWTSVTARGHFPAPRHRGPRIILLHGGARRFLSQGFRKAQSGRLCAVPSPGSWPLWEGGGHGRGDVPGVAPSARAPAVGMSPHDKRDDGRSGDRARFLSAGAARSPALMAAPRAHRRARASRCPAVGAEAEGRGRGARRGWAARDTCRTQQLERQRRCRSQTLRTAKPRPALCGPASSRAPRGLPGFVVRGLSQRARRGGVPRDRRDSPGRDRHVEWRTLRESDRTALRHT